MNVSSRRGDSVAERSLRKATTVPRGQRIRPCKGLAPKDPVTMAKQKKESQTEDDKAPMFPSRRLLLGSMNCLALLFLYLLRINLSLSMVCMVRKPLPGNGSLETTTNGSYSAFRTETTQSSSLPGDAIFFLEQAPVLPRAALMDLSASSTISPWISASRKEPSPTDLTRELQFSTLSTKSDSFHSRTKTRTAEANINPMTTAYFNDEDFNVTEEVNEHHNKGEFEWSRQFQGYVLSSYFYGYIVTQILGGFLSGKYGAKHVLGTGMIIMVVMTLLTPVAARLNAYLLICLRVVLGAAGGVFFPSVQSLWGPWAPPFERSFLVSLTFFGITLGNILALWLSSVFCSLSLDNGWPFAFYSTGAAGFVFWVCWNLCVYSTPKQHPRISEREKDYIQKCIGTKGDAEKPRVPWLKIVTSPAVLAILTAQTANTWFTHTSITLPFYMKDVLKFDVKQNGLFLILPYILDMIVTPFVSKLADYLRVKKILSTVAVRKIYQSTSCVVSSVLLITLSFIDYERRYGAVAILCLIYPFQNLYRSGYAVNPQDIAPKFAGEIFGITNTAGTIGGLISPVIVGALTTNGTKQEWQMVFFISAGFFIFGGVIFAIFAKGEIQPWADPTKATELFVNGQPAENGRISKEGEINEEYSQTIDSIQAHLLTGKLSANGKTCDKEDSYIEIGTTPEAHLLSLFNHRVPGNVPQSA